MAEKSTRRERRRRTYGCLNVVVKLEDTKGKHEIHIFTFPRSATMSPLEIHLYAGKGAQCPRRKKDGNTFHSDGQRVGLQLYETAFWIGEATEEDPAGNAALTLFGGTNGRLWDDRCQWQQSNEDHLGKWRLTRMNEILSVRHATHSIRRRGVDARVEKNLPRWHQSS